ncbi:BatD family protein [Vibrio gangliei]|uniref:BatD family protein n=1 Tax=Vibrio gangliei TaxID=2077090 RepID=UPI001300A3A4|nr:BatD family protein [Vibrio gangliei]
MYSFMSQFKILRQAQAGYKWFAIAFALMATMVFSPATYAKDVQATASVSQTRLSTNEVFNLQVAYMGAAHREDFDPSVLDKDFTQGAVQFGTSRYSINGDVTIRSEWNLSLATNKTGEVIIPSFTINGVKTDPITLHVSKDPSSPKQSDLIDFDDSISKTTLYPKETATFVSRLLVKTDPRGLQNTKLTPPSGEGLTITPVGDANQYQKIINGIETTVVEQKYQVTAEQSGEHQLIPTRLQAQVISISRSTGARRIVPVDVQSEPITLTVKEKPASFKGAWLPTQSLELQQGWQDSEGNTLNTANGSIDAKVGQPITRMLALVVKDVSAESLPDIKIDYPNSVRVYSEKPKFGQDKAGNTVMTLKQVIMPKKSGKITLPSVTVPWWNSQLGKAESAQAKGLTLNATVDENAPVQTSPMVANNNAQPATSEAPQPQATPTETKVKTIEEPGFWPYLTALFAALWIVTLLILIQQKRSQTQLVSQPQSSSKGTSKAQASDLVSILKTKDGVKIQAAYREWQAQYPNIEAELKQQIQLEMNQLMASLYSANQQDYDVKELRNLIKKAQSQRNTLKNREIEPL